MKTTQIALAGIVALLGSYCVGQQVDAAPYGHINRYAVGLQNQAGRLTNEFRMHYRHTSDFRHLISDARTLYSKAAHVARVARDAGSLRHLQQDLRDLDRTLHHIRNLVNRVEKKSMYCRSCGHVHGNTHHVDRILSRMDGNLHHLKSDIRLMQSARRYDSHGRNIGYGDDYRTRRGNREFERRDHRSERSRGLSFYANPWSFRF